MSAAPRPDAPFLAFRLPTAAALVAGAVVVAGGVLLLRVVVAGAAPADSADAR